jgi:hypothetical protein
MKCEVLRHFRIATDAMGVASKELNPGETHDVPDAMLAGLQAEGYVRPIAGLAKSDRPKKSKSAEPESAE